MLCIYSGTDAEVDDSVDDGYDPEDGYLSFLIDAAGSVDFGLSIRCRGCNTGACEAGYADAAVDVGVAWSWATTVEYSWVVASG